MTIRAEIIGSNTAIAASMTAVASAPVLELCRRLVDAGHDPTTPLEAYRGDMLCLRVKSIGAGAGLTVEDDRLGVPRLRRRRDGPQRAGTARLVRPIRDGAPGHTPRPKSAQPRLSPLRGAAHVNLCQAPAAVKS
jgi:hypothetical protein